MKRRATLALMGQVGLASWASVAALGLAGCGFKLRGSQIFTFNSIAILPSPGGPLAAELRRSFGGSVQVLPNDVPVAQAQVIVDILQELREKTVVGTNSSGQVRELQLRIRLKFKVRTPQGKELLGDTEIVQRRDLSFNESAVLAKDAEEALLYRDMQSDLVQQLLRRLSALPYAASAKPT
jgi:LPS-assembly lipoprotein